MTTKITKKKTQKNLEVKPKIPKQVPDFKFTLDGVIFSPKHGLGIITEILPENQIVKAKMLENGKTEIIGFHHPGLKQIDNFDDSLAVPRELKSTAQLKKELAQLAGLKQDPKNKKRTKRKHMTPDEIADLIFEKAMKGEKMTKEQVEKL